jgi:hypothetical protein
MSDEQTNKSALPAFGVAKSRHRPLLKHFYGRRAKMIGSIAPIPVPLGWDPDGATADHF